MCILFYKLLICFTFYKKIRFNDFFTPLFSLFQYFMMTCCFIFELHHILFLSTTFSYIFLCCCILNKISHCIHSWSFASVFLCPLYTNVNSRSSVKKKEKKKKRKKEKKKKSETRTKKIYKKTSPPTTHQQPTNNNTHFARPSTRVAFLFL